MVITYSSIVHDDILEEFANHMGETLFEEAVYKCGIEERLKAIAILWPEIVEVDGCVFIAEFFNSNNFKKWKEELQSKYQLERFINAESISNIFSLNSPSLNNNNIFDSFANALQFFWSLRLKTLFPEREFVVELGMYLEGEEGLTITLYEKLPEQSE